MVVLEVRWLTDTRAGSLIVAVARVFCTLSPLTVAPESEQCLPTTPGCGGAPCAEGCGRGVGVPGGAL